MTEPAYTPHVPEYAVVDTLTGHVFTTAPLPLETPRGTVAEMFTEDTAQEFARSVNAHMRPEYQSYKVFMLLPVDSAEDAAEVFETAAILADPETMAAIEEGDADLPSDKPKLAALLSEETDLFKDPS